MSISCTNSDYKESEFLLSTSLYVKYIKFILNMIYYSRHAEIM